MARKKSKAKKPTETMRQKQMRLRREAQEARVRGRAKARGGMTNLEKPTMQKLVRKAAQKRKAASGRPLVRKSELDKANKPSIKKGAQALKKPRPKAKPQVKPKVESKAMRDAVKRAMAQAQKAKRGLPKRGLLGALAAGTAIGTTMRKNLPKSTFRSGRGAGRVAFPGKPKTKRPMANLPKDYKKTEAAAFKGAQKPKPSGGSSSSTTTTRRAAAPRKAAAPKPKPKKSAIHTYKKHGSALHVGRYKTLKEHRAAVAKAKKDKKKK